MARARHKDDITDDQERRVWEMRRRGATQQRIAAELGIDQSTVSRMIQRMNAKLKLEFTEREEAIKIEQTLILEHIADEAGQAWEKSKSNAVIRRHQTKAEGVKRQPAEGEEEVSGMYLRPREDGDFDEEEDPEGYAAAQAGADDGIMIVTEEKKFTERRVQTGDAALLSQMRGALADIRTIWGIDAPKRQEISGPNGKPIEIDTATTQKATEELNEWRKQMTENLSSLPNVPPT